MVAPKVWLRVNAYWYEHCTLHAQVARLAKQLPNKSADLKPMARFFNSKMSDGTDPAEEAPEDKDGELDLT